jgi:hypothetical protein
LTQDFEEERGADFLAAVKGDRNSSVVGMVPAFVTACLACLPEAEFQRHTLVVADVALGVNDLGGVSGERSLPFAGLVRNHSEDIRELG